MIEHALRIVLVIFACYRLTELISIDDGPGHIFRKLREWAGRKSAENSNKGIWSNVAELLTCPFCLGIWFSILFIFPLRFPSTFGDIFIVILAISGAQTFLESMSNGRNT